MGGAETWGLKAFFFYFVVISWMTIANLEAYVLQFIFPHCIFLTSATIIQLK